MISKDGATWASATWKMFSGYMGFPYRAAGLYGILWTNMQIEPGFVEAVIGTMQEWIPEAANDATA